ncbi:citrate transporter [Salinisphaera dokdonensis CL-ES53]|uniref:Citrate transporter n=1 Tax=Salinisphaera dokdonensis CL-ES53 TaxID=1304272 RepID=A0ABV2B3Z1_9GAMM
MRAIDARLVFLFTGMLPLATAIQEPDLGRMLAEQPSPRIPLSVLFITSVELSQIMSNTATTALLAPISGSIVTDLGAYPSAALMAIAIGGSCAFATPLRIPANTMSCGLGG